MISVLLISRFVFAVSRAHHYGFSLREDVSFPFLLAKSAFRDCSFIALLAFGGGPLFGVGCMRLLCFSHADWPRLLVDSPSRGCKSEFEFLEQSKSVVPKLSKSIESFFYARHGLEDAARLLPQPLSIVSPLSFFKM